MKRACAAALCAAVAACAPVEPADGKAAPVAARTRNAAPVRAPDNVMAYLSELRTLNDGALAREIARQRQLLARDGSDLNRTRLAAALSLSPSAEESEILGLVEPVARKETAPADARAMASFLHAMASERRRLKESAAAANARVREERKVAEAQKERAAQLQQKLDALTELEKSLSDRPTTNTR